MTPDADAAIAHAKTLPPDALVAMRAGVVVELHHRAKPAGEATPLMTVADVARHCRVSLSTARGWFTRGLVPGAWRLGRSGWRADHAGLAALEARLKADADGAIDLGAWRRAKRPARRTA